MWMELEVLDPRPVPLAELAQADDVDLLGQLEARYGGDPASCRFRLVSVPLALLLAHEQIPAAGLAYYEQLARDDDEWEVDESLGEDELAELLTDGARRAEIVRAYRDDYLAGRPVAAPLIDWLTNSDEAEATLSMLDGFHRATGAHEAGLTTLACYELLPD